MTIPRSTGDACGNHEKVERYQRKFSTSIRSLTEESTRE